MNLLQMSISAGIMIIVIIIARALAINRLPKRTFLILWGLALTRLLLPFSFPSPFSVYSLANRTGITEQITNNPTVNIAPFTVPQIAGNAPGITSATGPVSLWLLIWLSGVMLCALYFTFSYFKYHREFIGSLPVGNSFVAEWLMSHKLKRRVQIRQSSRIKAPLTYGILHPVILMPKYTDWTDTKRLQYVLQHEYVHIRRFDTVTKILLTGALCVHWFNPMAWAMYVLANRDLELSCDESVVRSFGETIKSAYAMALISMEEQKSGFAPFCNNFSKNAIEERITAIMKTKKTTILSLALALILIAGTTTVFATSAAGAFGSDAQIVQSGVAFGNVSNTPIKDGSEKDGDVTLTPNDPTDFSSVMPHSENSVDATVTQMDTSSNNLGDSGNSRLSVSAGKEFAIGKATWGKGQQITLFIESKRENELEIGIKFVSTGKTYSEILKTGTGTVILPISEDGEYQIFVKNTSKTEADFSLDYMVNVP